MSSFDARGIRPASNDPLLQIFVELQKQVVKSIRDGQVALLDSDNEDIFSDGQDIDTAIKYHSELSSTHKFNFNIDYYPPEEPNGTTCKLMLKGWNTGNQINDESGFNHTANIWGDPTLVNGVMDLGIWTGPSSVKSIAMRLNRPTSELENQEWLQVPAHNDIKISDCAVGYSEHIRFKIFDIDQQHSKNRTILVKRDDITATPNDGRLIMMDSSGNIIFVVRDGGVTYAKVTSSPVVGTTPSTPTGNNPYDLYVTYNASSHAQTIYLGYYPDSIANGLFGPLTLSNYAGTITWPETTDINLNIFRRHDDTDGGYTYGDFYTYRMYKEKILSITEVQQHFANKWTIANIPFGKVMITGYWATYQEIGGVSDLPSFDPISFDPSSFTMTTGASFIDSSFTDISFTE